MRNGQNHVLLPESGSQGAWVRTAVAGIDDNDRLATRFRWRRRAEFVGAVGILVADRTWCRNTGHEARQVGGHHVEDETGRAVARTYVHRMPGDPHRLSRVDHHAGLARPEQSIAIGANQPVAL